MNKNNKIEDSLNKIFSTSSYKMVDVSSKEVTHRKALAVGEIILSSEVIKKIKNNKLMFFRFNSLDLEAIFVD